MEKEIHPMILEYTTAEDNETIKLPLSGKSLKAQVDWGDGSSIQTVTSAYPTHEYAKSGVYEAKISGIVPKIDSFYLSASECQYLTRIKSWGKLNELVSMNYAFCGCKNLRGGLPNDDYGCFENVTDFGYCFGYCSGLTSIPEGLFVNCPNADYFGSCFSNCYGLTDSIPENLFANCPNAGYFQFCFNGCGKLIGSIPKGLFANCPNVINFIYCFNGCTGLTGTTPVDILGDGTRIELWERAGKLGYPKLINGSACFYNCASLSNYSEIPDKWK